MQMPTGVVMRRTADLVPYANNARTHTPEQKVQTDRRLGLDEVLGPAVAVISFVCSIGNVPLAAVLRNGGISFGGVVAFLFADLIVLPIVDIWRFLQTGGVPGSRRRSAGHLGAW